MVGKLSTKTTVLTLATTAGILYILCVLFFAVAPKTTLNLFSYMFHGIDITEIEATTISFSNTLIGFIEIILLSLVIGWLFTVIYNYFASR